MDVINLMTNINSRFGTLLGFTWGGDIYSNVKESYEPVHIALIVIFLVALIVTVIIVKRWHKQEVIVKENLMRQTPSRFRKRDKALFYGRKMLRKVRSISGQVRNSGQGKKRKMVMKFARRLLQLKKETDTEQLKVLEPPPEYLQEDVLSDDRLPPDALYILQSIRIFGHFEKPVFLKLCKFAEIIDLKAGSFLFKKGDVDDNVYVIQSGKVNVYIMGADNAMLNLKICRPGDTIASLLSFIEVLMEIPSCYKTIGAKALENSTILKLPMLGFQEIFKENPEIFVRVMQVIMLRLQRVTFTTLHQYLGLTSELVGLNRKRVISGTLSASPSKVRTKSKEESVLETINQQPADLSQFVPANTIYQTSPLLLSHKRSKSTVEKPNIGNLDLISDSGSAPTSSQTPSFQKRKHSVPDIMDEELVRSIATEGFMKELGLSSDTILQGKIDIKDVTAGTYLLKQDSVKDVALLYVVTGSIIAVQKQSDREDDEVLMFTAHPGEIVGGLAVIAGEPSFFAVKAKHNSKIASISKDNCYSLMKDHPKLVLKIAYMVVQHLSPFVRQVDFALDWVFLESGRAIYRQDEDSDSTFLVLSGRLRSVITHENEKKEVVAEYGKGDLIGIVEMVTHTKRGTTVIGVRDSELAKLPEGLFNAIKLRFPIVVTRLIDLLGHRILGSWQKQNIHISQGKSAVDSRPTQSNFSTVAIVAVSDDVPLTAFTYELYHCLTVIGPTLRLTSDVIKKTLGATIMDPSNEYRLTSWLAQQEDQHKISLYQCDLTYSLWTQRCIRQADCILIVGLGSREPCLGKVEREVERIAMRTQKELVLLHSDGSKPHNTIAWRNMRSWVQSHHHILCPKRMFSRKSMYRINELYGKVCMSEPNIHSDFSRLARWLTGTSVGLVLGGGGARGSAHVGMIKAIQEAGIPIDMVGGVSIGAFMGALWCQERNITTVTQKAREWSKKMTQWWRQILDLTYPMTSMFSGRDFNQTIKGTFNETYIEDLWLPYFTITTDITASCMRIHQHGSLWRYVRSSMSLSGYMPPLCDPCDGHLLLDGGYTNNLPADVMRSLGANHILAIDVGSVDDQDLTNYGDDLSGWWLLWKRWYPFTSSVKVPNLPDIQSRLAYVSCVRQLEEVKTSGYCEYIRPPIDKYRTLQFGSFDEIKEVGYQHGKLFFEEQLKSGKLPYVKLHAEYDNINIQQHYADQHQHNFTDLAQMVCQITRPYDDDEGSTTDTSCDSDMEGHGYASEPSVGILDHDTSMMAHRRTGGSLSLSENELETELDITLKRKMNP
ncbi:neuropathy target esterase sws isoform X1 [Onthophagus taurus]|uniref:neuropathy target esterase sws isoform X1 n=1 Tax=Onthophagus taurus TaxID=166361 RepID=UPI0039BDD100